MVAVSRELFHRTIDPLSCQFLVHPDDPQCLVGFWKLGINVMKGSAKYFFLMYLAQNALKYKTLTAQDIPPILVSYVRSVLCGVWTVCSCMGIICLAKNLTGRFGRDNLAYVMGLVSGCGTYIDDPKRRPIVSYTLAALAVETLIRRLYKRVKRRTNLEVLGFMVFNGILMYKMRVSEHANCKRDMWFFRPSRLKTKDKQEESVDVMSGKTLLNACPHREGCYEYVMKDTSKYYIGALLFSATKLFISMPKLRRDPVSFIKTACQWNNLKLACFLGWYIGVYKGVSCALCRLTKKDKGEYAFIAGALAGLSYGLNGNLTILASLMLYVARIFGREIQEKYQLPKFHFVELSGILSMMTLINTRLFDPESCSRGFTFMFDVITQKRLNPSFAQFLKIIEEEKRRLEVILL